jgi:hypothetical protein
MGGAGIGVMPRVGGHFRRQRDAPSSRTAPHRTLRRTSRSAVSHPEYRGDGPIGRFPAPKRSSASAGKRRPPRRPGGAGADDLITTAYAVDASVCAISGRAAGLDDSRSRRLTLGRRSLTHGRNRRDHVVALGSSPSSNSAVSAALTDTLASMTKHSCRRSATSAHDGHRHLTATPPGRRL